MSSLSSDSGLSGELASLSLLCPRPAANAQLPVQTDALSHKRLSELAIVRMCVDIFVHTAHASEYQVALSTYCMWIRVNTHVG